MSFEKTKVWCLTYLVGSHSVVDSFYRKTTQEVDIQELTLNLFCLFSNTLRTINTVSVGDISVLDDNYIACKTK